MDEQHRSCKCGAAYRRTESMAKSREVNSFECVHCGARAARLPAGYVIALREGAPKLEGDPNWIAATGNLPREVQVRYESALIERADNTPS
jgi:hypothetical protein